MLICFKTSKERLLELIDYYTLKGEIVLLSCYNILEDQEQDDVCYIDMDKAKISLSDRLIVYGDCATNEAYIKELVEYCYSQGKEIIYTKD